MKKILTIAAALFFWGCNSSNNNKTDKTTPDNQTAVTPKTEAATAGTEIKVTLTGGPHAGTYTATKDETACSEGLTSENSFGIQYSEKGKSANELSGLQLIIDDKNLAQTGTDKFSLSISFGKLIGGQSYTINTKDGNGKTTLTESGQIKTVVVEGKTANGVGIAANITCHGVMTANGIQ